MKSGPHSMRSYPPGRPAPAAVTKPWSRTPKSARKSMSPCCPNIRLLTCRIRPMEHKMVDTIKIGEKEYTPAELEVLSKAGVLNIGEKNTPASTTPGAQTFH